MQRFHSHPFSVIFISALYLLVPLATYAQASKPVTTVSPKQIAPVGAPDLYKIEIKINAPSASGKLNVIVIREQFERRTLPRQSDGSQAVVDTFTTGTVSFGGTPQDILKLLPVVTITRDKEGKYSSRAEGGSAEGNPEVMGVLQQFAATATYLYPAKSVRTGDKWKISVENSNTLIGSSKLEGEAEQLGSEQREGEKMARVAFKFYEHQGDAQPQGEGTVYFGKNGHIVRLVQKGQGIFAGAPATVEMEIRRITTEVF